MLHHALSVASVQTCAHQKLSQWRTKTSPETDNGERMKQFDLVGDGVKLVLKGNVLAVLSDAPLNAVSSTFHNGGGLKKTRAILNVEVIKS